MVFTCVFAESCLRAVERERAGVKQGAQACKCLWFNAERHAHVRRAKERGTRVPARDREDGVVLRSKGNGGQARKRATRGLRRTIRCSMKGRATTMRSSILGSPLASEVALFQASSVPVSL